MLQLIIKAVDEGRVQDLIDAGLQVRNLDQSSREILEGKINNKQCNYNAIHYTKN